MESSYEVVNYICMHGHGMYEAVNCSHGVYMRQLTMHGHGVYEAVNYAWSWSVRGC